MEEYLGWTCLFTQPLNERRALASLKAAGLEAYLPSYKTTITHSRKRRIDIRPLFPRYIFARAVDDPTTIRTAYRMRGISGFVGKTLQNSIIRDEIVELLRARETSDGLVTMNFVGLSIGQKVKLIEGPLAGFEAIFQETDDQRRTWIFVELLGKMHRMKVDRHHLMPLD